MKKGRTSWTTKLTDATRTRLFELLDAGVKSDREIFDALNLSRVTKYRTYRSTATLRRKERAERKGTREPGNQGTRENFDGRYEGRGEQPEAVASSAASGPPFLPSPPSSLAPADELTRAIALCVGAITDSLVAGKTGKVDAAKALRSLTGLRELNVIKEPAEQRAAELHEAKRRELRQALDKAGEGGKTTMELADVVELVDRVMTGGA